jgi:hypothetical protein
MTWVLLLLAPASFTVLDNISSRVAQRRKRRAWRKNTALAREFDFPASVA